MLKSELEAIKSMNYLGRTVIQGRSGGKRAWGNLAWEGQSEAWNILPDGRDIWDVLQAGDLGALPPCWINISNTGMYGDLIWNDAVMFSFVSERFVSAIEEAGFSGYQLRPLEVQPKSGDRFSGYSLLLPDKSDPDAPIRSFPFVHRPTSALDISDDVAAALRHAGVTDFDSEDAGLQAVRVIEA